MNPDHNRHVQPPAPPLRPKKPRPVLRTHKRAFFLLTFYIAIILIPWIITAILSYHPLTLSSWTYAPGISYKDYKPMQGWARAIPILNAVAAILAVPILSSIIAQAMVVFAQRRHPGQQLSVRQLFKLADRSWGNLGTLHKMLWWNEPGYARVNWFLIACTGLVVLGAVQFPLYQLLAPWKEITMPTCEDTRYIDYGVGKRTCDFDYRVFKELGYTQVGIDLEPAQMAVIPQQYILPRMRNDLATLNPNQVQPYIWKSPLSYGDTTISYEGLRGFVAALPSKTTTGVLREHIMRLNSTAVCVSLEMSEFPTTCSGENPFQASFEYKGLYDWGSSPNISTVDICAPGDLGKHPWTVSRNKQDISEEVFLKFTGERYDEGVLHCTGQTTRGYFELGNIHNGDTFGPLLEKWPSSGPSLEEYQFNDYMGFDWGSESHDKWGDGYIPSEEDTDRGGARPIPDRRTWRDYEDTYPPDTYTNMSGPLMTSVLAFFGQDSWVHGLANLTSERDEDRDTLTTMYSDRPALLESLCDALPFRHFSSSLGNTYGHDQCSDSLLDLMTTYSDHMSRWSLNTTAADRLSTAMFLANQAALTSHTAGILPWQRDTGREIYTAPGTKIWKPNVSLPSLIILSVIVGVQVIGLLWLGWWIFKWPTWTRTLDAMAIARVAARIDPSLLPPFKTIGQKDWEKLAHVDGLIGAQLQEVPAQQQRGPGSVQRETAEEADIEMRALSVASTVGKEPTSEAVPAPTSNASSISLGLGAPDLVSKRWGKHAQPAPSLDHTYA